MKKYRRIIFIIGIMCMFTFVMTLLSVMFKEEPQAEQVTKVVQPNIVVERQVEVVSLNEEEVEEDVEPVFSSAIINQEVFHRISSKSFRPNEYIRISDLRYLSVTYYGFDELTHQGELIVNKDVADELLEIFKELYEARYPIYEIKLVDEYEADDDLSMAANNTSAFNYRKVTGSKKLSMHGYGLAIDINPIQNPYVKKDIVLPESGQDYIERDDVKKGMIVKDDACYNAFISRGWTWGGDWDSLKDYQHFEKSIK